MTRASSPRAFADLSLAEQWLLAHLPPILELRPGETLQAGLVLGNMRVVATPPPLLSAIVLDQAAFLAGPAVGRAQLEGLASSALVELARARAWRRIGTLGPPVASLFTNDLWNALARSGAVEEQELVDRVYAEMIPDRHTPRGALPTLDWRAGAVPRLLSSWSVLTRSTDLPRITGEPFIVGSLQQGWMSIEAFGISKGVVVRAAPDLVRYARRNPSYEVLTDSRLPEASVAGCVGRPVGEVFGHPSLDALGGTVVTATRLARSVRFRVLTGAGQHKVIHPGQVVALSEEMKLADKARTAVVDALERAVGGARFGEGSGVPRWRRQEFADAC